MIQTGLTYFVCFFYVIGNIVFIRLFVKSWGKLKVTRNE